MAEKKKGRKRKEEFNPPGQKDEEKPPKEEYAIAKWLRKNVPTKKTKFLNHNVEYFTGYKAVDALMESQWAKPPKEGQTALFSTRAKCIEYLNTMLRHKFYHRAKKIPVTEQELKARKKGTKKSTSEKENTDVDEKKLTDNEGKKGDGDKADKKKRKVRLEMHLDQYFDDGRDAYVWIYDPVPVYYWFFGTLLVLGAIVVCLFPLWPPSVRGGVYYLSLAAIGFLSLFIGLVVLRLIVFCLLWLLTLGKHHLWLLPNLTEDVGFFASFWPLYHYECKGGLNDKKDKKKKKKKDKNSDGEEDDQSPEINEDKPVADDERVSETEVLRTENSSPEDRRISESESESSQRSSTGRDFEIVEKEDIEAST